MGTVNMHEIEQLTIEERIQLVEEIWDSIAATPENLELTEAQKQELDKRLEEYQRDKFPGEPWEDVKAELQANIRTS